LKLEIIPRKKEIEVKLLENGISFVYSRFSLPVLLKTGGGALLKDIRIVAIEWLFDTVVEGFKARSERKKIISDNPLSYLFMAQKDLN
jgi:hypothetical protein